MLRSTISACVAANAGAQLSISPVKISPTLRSVRPRWSFRDDRIAGLNDEFQIRSVLPARSVLRLEGQVIRLQQTPVLEAVASQCSMVVRGGF
jgi:hypothetical protein